MTLPQDLTLVVRDWLHEPDELPPPRIAEVSQRVRQTPQERGLLPRLDLGRVRMLSAVKFVAAGVIVALFGGFLLMGVLTTQQDGEVLPAAVTESPEPAVTSEPNEAPTTSVRSDILPGVTLTVEEVEPGVYRVVNDGIRDLAKANNRDIVAGHDGGIWLLRPQRFFRLGGDEWRTWATKKPGITGFEVAPDGTVWAMLDQYGEGGGLFSVGRGSDEWTLMTDSPFRFEVTSDGTLWAGGYGGSFGCLGPDGWQSVGEWPERGGYRTLLVSDRGEVWAVRSRDSAKVQRFVDGEWLMDQPPSTGEYLQGWGHGAAVGPDGTFWGHNNGAFFRFDGTGWMTFGSPEWMQTDVRAWRLVEDEWVPLTPAEWRAARPSIRGVHPAEVTSEGLGWGEPHVAPDGSLWVPPRLGESGVEVRSVCDHAIDGVARFDGKTWSRYLLGHCVQTMDIAGDGSVWLLATESDEDLRHLSVITPEAVAAAE
jgi:hypothetical protein